MSACKYMIIMLARFVSQFTIERSVHEQLLFQKEYFHQNWTILVENNV